MNTVNNPVRPEDILSDDDNTVNLNGLVARKGSIAAFLRNIDIFEDSNASPEQKAQAVAVMQELAPVLIATGLSKHAMFKNPEVQKLLEV